MKKIFLTLFCMLIAVQAFAQAAAEDNKNSQVISKLIQKASRILIRKKSHLTELMKKNGRFV